MPKGQFYALAIFVMGRLGWKVIISLRNLNKVYLVLPQIASNIFFLYQLSLKCHHPLLRCRFPAMKCHLSCFFPGQHNENALVGLQAQPHGLVWFQRGIFSLRRAWVPKLSMRAVADVQAFPSWLYSRSPIGGISTYSAPKYRSCGFPGMFMEPIEPLPRGLQP